MFFTRYLRYLLTCSSFLEAMMARQQDKDECEETNDIEVGAIPLQLV